MYALSRRRAHAASEQPTQSGTDIEVTWGGVGAGGTFTPAQDGYLPDLLTTIRNPSGAAHHYQVAVGSPQFPWFLDTRAGHGVPSDIARSGTPSMPGIGFTLAAGQVITLPWTTLWSSSYGTGPFEVQLAVVVDSMSQQTFTDPTTFTISVTQTPPAPAVSFSGGPSGTISIDEGASATLPTLTTVLTNTGQATGTFTMTCAITGPTSGLWYVASAPSSATIGDYANVGVNNSGVQITLAGGASATITWSTQWTDAQPNQDGTYTTVATVSW